METLHQCTIFVDLALLAIVIAIFVFASSFYRGALELSAKEEENSLNRRKELMKNKRSELAEKIKNTDEGDLAKELRAELDKFDAELKDIDQSITKSKNKPKALAVKNLATIPGSLLLASIVLSGTAIATSETLQTIMWSLSLALLVVSVYFIYKNLSAVEFFSGIIDLSTLMEQALERHAEKRRPIVDLDIPEYQLIIKHGETQEVNLDIFLEQGLTAKNIKIRFVATKELDFPEEKLQKLGINKKNMRNPRFFFGEVGDLNYGVYREITFKVKAPDARGEYTMSHWITCDEFTAEEKTFTIKVI